MLKIRLMRIGSRKRPFYRVVVMEERSKRTGAFIEALGTYNPLTEPKEIKLKQDRIDYWTKQGAQMSIGYLRMKGIAPQKKPRKPKKAKKEETSATTPTAEVTPSAETPAPQRSSVETQPASEEQPTEQEVSANTSEKSKGATKEEADTQTSEAEVIMDDSAENTPSSESGSSESVQKIK